MMRTAANVNGDGVITMIVAHGEDYISMDVFNDPNAGTLEPVYLPHGTARKYLQDATTLIH